MDRIKEARRARRRVRREEDPYFGKRRPAGEVGRHKTKAGQDKRAARGRNRWTEDD